MPEAPDLYPVLPGYLDRGVTHLTPGHVFGMYAVWKKQGKRKQGQMVWENKLDKARMVSAAAGVSGQAASEVARSLAQRLRAVVARGPGVLFELTLTSPLATGLGNEHPVENGFTFSVPHGLPVLPGSSIKGTVRAAAERLALAGEGGWDLRHVWLDLGFDANAGYLRAVKEGLALHDERKQWREAYRAHVEQAPVQDWDDLQHIWPTKAAKAQWKAGDEKVRRAMLRALQEPQASERRAHAQDASLDPSDLDPAQVHFRGALVFHDGWFVPAGGRLLTQEIMTPHFGDYYHQKEEAEPPTQKEGAEPPTDDRDPTPIPFLAVARGCVLHLGVSMAPPSGAATDERWRERLGVAVRDAGEALGFGAKGGAGYGRAKIDKTHDPHREWCKQREEARKRAEAEAAERAREEALAKMGPVERLQVRLEAAEDGGAVSALLSEAEKDGLLSGDDRGKVAAGFKTAMQRLGLWTTKKQKRKWKERTERLTAILEEAGHA